MKVFVLKESAINTGTVLPAGARVFTDPACERCEARERPLCMMRITHDIDGPLAEMLASICDDATVRAMGRAFAREYKACAECLADFVASKMCAVDVQHVDGAWRRVAARQ